jgi:protein SCO1/2
MNRAALLLALALGAAPLAYAAPPLPGDSLYQLHLELTAADAGHHTLAEFRGRPALVTMFYASCPGVCPLVAFAMRRMNDALTPEQRANLRMVMVSFDPEHDTPAALAEFARLNQLEEPRWLLATTPAPAMRELAAALGIRFRGLPGGGFSHSTVITLVDADGVPRARTSTLAELDADFMKTLTALASGRTRAEQEAP